MPRELDVMAKECESLNAKAEVACMHRDGHNIAECAAGTSGQTSEWYITEVKVNCSRIRMLGRANTARFDFDIRLGIRTCGHDTSHHFGERLVIHVEEHGANGWRPCRSHTVYMLLHMCRVSFLSESSSTDSSDERAWFADYAGVKVEGPFKGEQMLH